METSLFQEYYKESVIMDDHKIAKMDVMVETEYEEKIEDNYPELIPDVPVTINKNNELNFSQVVLEIKKMGFDLDNNLISYWSPSSDMYIVCGKDPLPKNITLIHEDYKSENMIKIKCRKIKKNLLHQLMNYDEEMQFLENKNSSRSRSSSFEVENDEDSSQKTSNLKSITKCRRTKERKIGYIIKKVLKWRQYYNGMPNSSGNPVRCSLEESAQKVGISKKSLDDYLLQIRFGKKFGFNFNEHHRDKVGVLRAFVKKKKKEAEAIKKECKNEDKKRKKIKK